MASIATDSNESRWVRTLALEALIQQKPPDVICQGSIQDALSIVSLHSHSSHLSAGLGHTKGGLLWPQDPEPDNPALDALKST